MVTDGRQISDEELSALVSILVLQPVAIRAQSSLC